MTSSYIQQVSDEAMRFREFILQLVINNFVQVKNMAVHPLHTMVSSLVYSSQPRRCWLRKGGNSEGWLLLRLEVLFCSIQLQYECQIFILWFSSGIYAELIRLKQKPYSTVEKCAVITFDIEKIQKIKLNREDTVFIDI